MPDDASKRQRLARLPKVDEVLNRADVAAEVGDTPRWAVVEAVRREIEALRKGLLAGGSDADLQAAAVARRARELVRPSLRPVINATGVVLHTNLGRAPLAAEAAARVAEIARGYANLEYDVDGRERGSRHDHLRDLLAELTGAEAAVVVNNNAAAVMLALSATAAGREVIVSRGELVEIGGSFRIPDVLRASGARLVEVGTTNKTKRKDYEEAITGDTAALLKVHKSNFAIVGFTEEVSVEDLVAIGRAPVIVDLGSGTLIDPATWGLPPEPTVGAVVRAGAALTTFSGDKLLGGPQAGVICGRAIDVERCRKHPLMRALRPDKLTLAALEATLRIYRDGRAASAVPALRMLSATREDLAARARALAVAIAAPVDVVDTTSAVGGGALPLAEPPSSAIALPEAMDAVLRGGEPPIVGRIADGKLLLDVRTIFPEEMAAVAERVRDGIRTLR